MTQVPAWLQITAHVVAILAGIGGAAFALGVLWPSIRQSNRASKKLCDAIDGMGKKGVDDLLGKL